MSASTSGFSGFSDIPGSWSWDNVPKDEPAPEPRQRAHPENRSPPNPRPATNPAPSGAARPQHARPQQNRPQRERTYRPRTCRICLETVQPTFHPPSENLPSMFQGQPSVSYESEDGRLISPCKCKGSSKYVHEKCLQEWRHSDISYSRRTFWQCPTCGFQYRLERVQWGRWIDSYTSQITLTVIVFFLSIFILGFIADPIINLYMDPFGTLVTGPFAGLDGMSEYSMTEEQETWTEHLAKGLASMGFIGAAKAFLSAGIFHIRGGFGMGRGRMSTGRDRFSSYTWIVIVIGVVTFVYTVWKGVRAWCKRMLKKAGERVMDVQSDGDDDEEDED